MKLCQILTKSQYDALFGRLNEVQLRSGDPVLDWYKSVGMKNISYTNWDEYISNCLGHNSNNWDEDWLERMDGAGEGDEEWLNAAKRFIREELGTDEFVFAGQGSMKVALVDKAGHALKFGRCGDSLKQEIRINLTHPKAACFPKVYAYAPDFTSYMCECARESKPEDFKKTFGSNFDRAWKFVSWVQTSDSVKIKKFLAATGVSAEQTESIMSLKHLFESGIRLTDIDENNWGVAKRNGKDVLIIIDYDM